MCLNRLDAAVVAAVVALESVNGVGGERARVERARQRVEREPRGARVVAFGGVAQIAKHAEREGSFESVVFSVSGSLLERAFARAKRGGFGGDDASVRGF